MLWELRALGCVCRRCTQLAGCVRIPFPIGELTDGQRRGARSCPPQRLPPQPPHLQSLVVGRLHPSPGAGCLLAGVWGARSPRRLIPAPANACRGRRWPTCRAACHDCHARCRARLAAPCRPRRGAAPGLFFPRGAFSIIAGRLNGEFTCNKKSF